VRDLLLVFLKWPEPGRTKTRLIPALGPETAAALYRLLAEAVIEATRPRAGEYERLLCYSPAESEARIQGWFPGETVWPQPEGDLGHRMASAFRHAFQLRAERAALVGTDVPALSHHTVREALRALDAVDLVLGPARDGGYYLLAAKAWWPELFAGMAWSSPAVFGTTCERAAALGLRTQVLDFLDDVDSIDDLAAGWDRLEPILEREPAVRDAVVRALAERRAGDSFGAQ
jgi:rSAM/selenodomain-associated transferase 1